MSVGRDPNGEGPRWWSLVPSSGTVNSGRTERTKKEDVGGPSEPKSIPESKVRCHGTFVTSTEDKDETCVENTPFLSVSSEKESTLFLFRLLSERCMHCESLIISRVIFRYYKYHINESQSVIRK